VSAEADSKPCPSCHRPTRWTGNPHRPFCSQRCRIADLGAWAAERYRVPGEAISEDDDTGDPPR
jgi:endogenous inhibitor of DNA gyrase (YacG/DUF329 family)